MSLALALPLLEAIAEACRQHQVRRDIDPSKPLTDEA